MVDDLPTFNRRTTRARLHIKDDSEFVTKIITNRDKSAYPDPYLREVDDVDLLKQYLTRIKTAIESYTPESNEESEVISEFYQREQERVNAQIGRLTVPHPSEHGLDSEFVDRLERKTKRTGYGVSRRSMPWDIYETLYEDCSLRELRVLSAYFKAKKRKESSVMPSQKMRVLNSIRYVRDDPTVSLDNILTFVPIEEMQEKMRVEVDGEVVDLEEGVPFDEIKEELERVISEIPCLKVALALANIGQVANYHNPRISNGRYNVINTNISHRMGKTEKTERNVIAHEFFHSLQDITATRDLCMQGNAVEFDASPDEWNPIGFPSCDRYPNVQKEVKELWFKLRNGRINPLCEYQMKNIDEMFAVGFEAYLENPDVLKKKQPSVYEHFETLFA